MVCISAAAQTKLWISLALSMVGGYVDVICFVRYSTFVATMTGNLVVTGQTFFEVVHAPLKFGGRAMPGLIAEHVAPATAFRLVVFRCSVLFFNCLGALGYCALHKRIPIGTARAAAPFLALFSLMPDAAIAFGFDHDSAMAMGSVSFLAFALGFTHFMCSPAAEGSRLKGVTMAATGHMHGVTKLNYKLASGEGLKQAEWDKYAISMTITVGMAFGAILGAAALHLNPLGKDTMDFTLLPVAVTLLFALYAHDACVPPPGGWPEGSVAFTDAATSNSLSMLTEPLRGSVMTTQPA